jgi:hypothetical protein
MPKWLVHLRDEEPVIVEGYPRIVSNGSLKFYRGKGFFKWREDDLTHGFCIHAWVSFERVEDE